MSLCQSCFRAWTVTAPAPFFHRRLLGYKERGLMTPYIIMNTFESVKVHRQEITKMNKLSN